MNELLWLAFLLIDLTVVLLMFRLFGRLGLYAVIVWSVILCNIQVLKIVDLFEFTSTLGNVLYGSIFLATDILNEVHGRREARRGVIIGFLALAAMTLYMQFALWFKPSEFDEFHGPLDTIFSLTPAILISSATAYLISQFADVWLFDSIRTKTKGRLLWLRNNGSTLLSQLLDTAVFTGLMVVFGVFPREVAQEVFVTTYVMKLLVAVFDTPFMYMAKRVAPVESWESESR